MVVPVVIRDAELSDVPAIVSLACAAVYAQVTPAYGIQGAAAIAEGFTPRTVGDTLQYLDVSVATLDGALAGFISHTAATPEEVYINSLYVAPVFHGRGVGTALLADSLERLRNVMPRHSLVTLNALANARRFYERNNFCRGRVQKAEFGSVTLDVFHMYRPLWN